MANDSQSYLRIAAASVGFFDYVMTFPSEYRYWRRQKPRRYPSIGFVLFMMCRYLGLTTLVLATIFYFGDFFTPQSCSRWVFVGGMFRILLSEAAACVLLWRTWAIWGRNRIVFTVMATALIPVTAISFASIAHQKPMSTNGNCTGKAGTGFFQKWPFSAANLVYDSMACVLATWRLVHNVKRGQSPVSKLLLHDGILYFISIMVGHILNLYFFLQTNPALNGIMQLPNVTLMMVASQRMLTSLSERISDSSTPSTRSRFFSRTRSRSFGHKPVFQRPTRRASILNMIRPVLEGARWDSDERLGSRDIGGHDVCRTSNVQISVYHETQVDGDNRLDLSGSTLDMRCIVEEPGHPAPDQPTPKLPAATYGSV